MDLNRSPTKLWEGNVFTGICYSVHRSNLSVCLGYTWDKVYGGFMISRKGIAYIPARSGGH